MFSYVFLQNHNEDIRMNGNFQNMQKFINKFDLSPLQKRFFLRYFVSYSEVVKKMVIIANLSNVPSKS